MKRQFTWYDEDDVEHEEMLPAKWVVCDDCEGEGSTLTESLRGAFTAEEFYECFDDEESREEYFKGGHGAYGVTCKTCGGRTTVLVFDEDMLDPVMLARVRESEADQRKMDHEDAYTRRMESGGW